MNANQKAALHRLEQKLLAIFATLQGGEDVSPAQSFRAEGFAQALVELGICSETEVEQAIKASWQQIFQAPPPDYIDPLSIPVIMQRAPVYPSTPD